METTEISLILSVVNSVYSFYTNIVKPTLAERRLTRVEHSKLLTALMNAIDTTRRHMKAINLIDNRVNRLDLNQMPNGGNEYDLPVEVVKAWDLVRHLCEELDYRDNNLQVLAFNKIKYWRRSEEYLNSPEKMPRIATLSEMDEIYQQISEKLIPNN